MSSDFLNFGTSAVEIAGTLGIVNAEVGMLKNAQKSYGGGPHKCKHCGSVYASRSELMEHHRMTHGRKHNEYGGKSNQWEFDFRI